jgi:hypothetical protein
MEFNKHTALIFVVFFLTSCSSDRWKVDTSAVEYNAAFARLDKDVFSIEPDNASEELLALRSAYGPFLDMYLGDIMQVGPASNPMSAGLLLRFTSDPLWEELQKSIEARHPNLDAESAALGEALRRYAVHFDTRELPALVAYNSGFNVGIYPSKTTIGVGLEWYSGSDLDVVKQLPPDLFPQYKRNKMQPEYLAINALKGWLFYTYQDQLTGDDLLARMVFSGKVLYTAQALMGEVEEETLLNYTSEEMTWARDHEFDVWKHFVENDAIFSTDQMNINKMMNDGPFTPGMPTESPGGVGTWVGYRMVHSFMEKNKDTTLPQLMRHKADRDFLKYYKPGR